MNSKFRFAGQAEILHINARKEGPDDDKQLAVDLKLSATATESALYYFDDQLALFLYTDIGAVRNTMLGPIPIKSELEEYRMEMMGSTHYGVKVKKFSLEPKDDRQVVITFQVSFKPSGDEVAQLAEYLQDAIDIVLEPANDELDLGSSEEKRSTESQMSMIYDDDRDDPMYSEACSVVMREGRASISLVQRELRIGYNRAARLVEAMEADNIVTKPKSDGSREVLTRKAA